MHRYKEESGRLHINHMLRSFLFLDPTLFTSLHKPEVK